jgi:hypothetical protein
MTISFPVELLATGDHLLYDVDSLWSDPGGFLCDWVIRTKTWSDVAHIEIYDGNGMSLASRAGGVNRYPFRAQGLKYILRPNTWNHVAATAYFLTVKGQGYDWKGLLCFTLAVRTGANGKQFCSEFARNLDAAAGCPSFYKQWPADLTAPGMFKASPAFIWLDNPPKPIGSE